MNKNTKRTYAETRLMAIIEEILMFIETKSIQHSGKKRKQEVCSILTLTEIEGCEDGLPLANGVGFGDVVGLLLIEGDDVGFGVMVGSLEMVGEGVP